MWIKVTGQYSWQGLLPQPFKFLKLPGDGNLLVAPTSFKSSEVCHCCLLHVIEMLKYGCIPVFKPQWVPPCPARHVQRTQWNLPCLPVDRLLDKQCQPECSLRPGAQKKNTAQPFCLTPSSTFLVGEYWVGTGRLAQRFKPDWVPGTDQGWLSCQGVQGASCPKPPEVCTRS